MRSLRNVLAALGGLKLATNTTGRPAFTAPPKTVSGLISESSRSIASTTNETVGMRKIYKSLGMKPPRPRTVSPDAQKVHDEFFKKVSRAPRAASTSAIRRRPHKKQALSYSTLAYPSQQYGTRPAILGAEVAPVSMLRMLSSDSGTTAEEDQVDRILDAGAKKLFDSEEGRERLRDGSFNIDETAKTMLEAAKEALEEGDGEECAEDSKKATEAAEELKSGSMQVGKLAERVKDKVTGLGQTG